MQPSRKTWNPIAVSVTFMIIPLFTNFVTWVCQLILTDWILTPADQALVDATFQGTVILVFWLPFLVPFGLGLFYLWPLIRATRYHKVRPPTDQEKRRLLNAPFVSGLIGVVGWLISIVGFFYGVYTNQIAPPPITSVRYIIGILLIGNLCFVIIYYLLEFISRRYYIPRFFPDGDISACENKLKLSVRARFYIYFSAVSIFPTFLLYSMAVAQSELAPSGGLFSPLTVIAGLLFALGAFLTYLISRSYQVPLVAMKQATGQIQGGDFDIHVAVVSDDEIGRLGEGLNEMAIELKEKEFIKDTFGKMVDPRVRDHLLRGHINLGGQVREVTILFSDIRGFTPMSEKIPPGQVVELLNRYFEYMSPCIAAEHGLVNKYIGDAIMAIFGVPLAMDDHTDAALRAALKMRAACADLNADLSAAGLPNIRIGIGIHTGPVVAGNIGSSSRMEYTVVGDTVNVASRIEGLCKELHHDLIISESTAMGLGEDFALVDSQTVKVRGKEDPIRVYRV